MIEKIFANAFLLFFFAMDIITSKDNTAKKVTKTNDDNKDSFMKTVYQ